jgi:DNA-binding transcriptional ArsR family regulator
MDIFDYLKIDKPLDQLAPSYFSILVDLIQDTFNGPKSDLQQLSEILHKTLLEQLRLLAPEVRNGILHDQHQSPELRQAYALGQISLAQHLLASITSKRIDDSFIPTLLERKFRPMLKLLLAKDMTGVDLAKETSSTPETISRKLRQLRAMGAADFRRDGTHVVNFLTHVAKDVLAEHGIKQKSVRGQQKTSDEQS